MLSDLLENQLKTEAPAPVTQTPPQEPWGERVRRWMQAKRSGFRHFFSRETVVHLQDEGKTLLSLVSFFGLLLIFLLELVGKAISHIAGIAFVVKQMSHLFQGHAWKWSERLVAKLESKTGGVRRSFLIALAFRNMRTKRTRSFVTVGGMGLGIAAIVFLVSIGYGLQNMVVSRVARLEELKMADVTLAQAANIRLDQGAVETIAHIPGVERVMPLVSLVGKVKFGGGVSESVVYGVTSDYLAAAGLNKVKGEYFESMQAMIRDARVAGASTEWHFEPAQMDKPVRNVAFNLNPDSYVRVRATPSTTSEIIGYVRRVEGGFEGVEYWGQTYIGDDRGREGKLADGTVVGRWIKAPFPLWNKEAGAYAPVYDSERVQEWKEGYIAEIDVTVDEDASSYIQWDDVTAPGSVLGEATGSAEASAAAQALSQTTVATTNDAEASIAATVLGKDENGVEWVSLGGDASGSAQTPQVMVITTPADMQKEAVVNRAFITLLGLDPSQAVGSSFEVSFVILNTLKPDLDRPAESEPTKYVIRAVVEEGNSPIMYVPLSDITKLGITNYSQAKLVAADKNQLGKVRQQVDNLGYSTTSVADTVAQIDKLFGTARAVLATFGFVALAVASLGMFNTLTVSLMERTREVGIMKAMGMQSFEVKELFLAEAMVMGLLGGVFGVAGGFVAGKLLSVVLSAFSLAKGVGWIDIAYIPPGFVAFVLILSFLVGVVTGIYPAKRATKISALNALRYE